MTDSVDHVVDVLVVGSGGGGMTAALAADARGLDTLVVEKGRWFGGSTALSGGGIWVPGAPAQRREGYDPSPEGVLEYLRHIAGAQLIWLSRFENPQNPVTAPQPPLSLEECRAALEGLHARWTARQEDDRHPAVRQVPCEGDSHEPASAGDHDAARI